MVESLGIRTHAMYREQRAEKLTKFLRLEVYKFLSIEDTLKLTLLSKTEHHQIFNSQILREERSFDIVFGSRGWIPCYICEPETLKAFMKDRENNIKLAGYINMTVELTNNIRKGGPEVCS